MEGVCRGCVEGECVEGVWKMSVEDECECV